MTSPSRFATIFSNTGIFSQIISADNYNRMKTKKDFPAYQTNRSAVIIVLADL